MAITQQETAEQERSLFQEAEILRGASSTVLNLARRLDERLRGPRPEKMPEEAERAASSPAAVIENAQDDLGRVDRIISTLIEYVGTAGEGPR